MHLHQPQRFCIKNKPQTRNALTHLSSMENITIEMLVVPFSFFFFLSRCLLLRIYSFSIHNEFANNLNENARFLLQHTKNLTVCFDTCRFCANDNNDTHTHTHVKKIDCNSNAETKCIQSVLNVGRRAKREHRCQKPYTHIHTHFTEIIYMLLLDYRRTASTIHALFTFCVWKNKLEAYICFRLSCVIATKATL